jgi:hypothetical protein
MSTLAQNSVALQVPQAARYVQRKLSLVPSFTIPRLTDSFSLASYMTAASTFVPTGAMIRAAYEVFNASIPLVQNVTGLSWVINMEPLPPQLYAHDSLDANALGPTKKNESLVVFLVSLSWTDAAQDDIIYQAAQSIIADVDARAKALGAYDPYIYLNYAGPWQQVIRSYSEESVTKLQALRKRVDPGEVSTRKVPGGFKIPESS